MFDIKKDKEEKIVFDFSDHGANPRKKERHKEKELIFGRIDVEVSKGE